MNGLIILADSDNFEFDGFFVFVMILAIVTALYRPVKTYLIRRRLRSKPYKTIGEYENGEEATLVGAVQIASEKLVAPFTGRKCSMFKIVVTDHGDSDDGSTDIIEEEGVVNFLIQDGNDVALIYTSKVILDVQFDRNMESGFLNDMPKAGEDFLVSRGHDSKNWLGFNENLEIKEGILEVGERVAVTGFGHWMDAADHNLETKSGKVLLIQSDGDQSVYISDSQEVLRLFRR